MDCIDPGLTAKATRKLHTSYVRRRIVYGKIVCTGYKTIAKADEILQT